MEGTGICSACNAEDVVLNDDSKCTDCAGAVSDKTDDDMDGPPEGMTNEDEM